MLGLCEVFHGRRALLGRMDAYRMACEASKRSEILVGDRLVFLRPGSARPNAKAVSIHDMEAKSANSSHTQRRFLTHNNLPKLGIRTAVKVHHQICLTVIVHDHCTNSRVVILSTCSSLIRCSTK